MKQVLQYLWIEKYKCIEKQGFNFTRSAEIKFDYDTGKLSIEKNKNYCENFFGDNIELSCIVGQNGVGKTTLLRAIKEIFSLDYGTPEYNCVAIFYDGSKYEGWYKLNDCKIDCDETQLELHPLKGKKLLNGQLVTEYKKADYLYYSEQFVQNLYSMPYGEDELSTSHLLFDEGYGETGDHINRFFLKEFQREIELISDYGKQLEKFKIRYAPYVTAEILGDDETWEKLVEYVAENDSEFKAENSIQGYIDFYNTFLCKHSYAFKTGKDAFKEKLAEGMFLSVVKEEMNVEKTQLRSTFDDIVNIMSMGSNISAWENLKNFLEEYYPPNKEGYSDFIEYIDNKCKVSKWDMAFAELKMNCKFIIPTSDDITAVTDLKSNIEEFFNYYRKAAKSHNFINFSWGLSSGETSLLNIFSRLYSSKCRKESKNEAAVFLLDEIDVTLHPEWQRTIINELLQFIKYAFKDKYVQVIMTTHSPIMLSDIPKQNVLFLKKSDDGVEECDGCDTFASNIFQLFREGFFIGETGIGVYAEEKLKEIVDHIHNNDIDDNELRKLISAVGDTFLRNKLNEEYLLYRSQKNDTEKIQAERIAKLESANTELLKQQRLDHEEKANHKKEAEKILKKLDDLNYNEDNTMEVTETKKKPMDDLADVIREFMQRFID